MKVTPHKTLLVDGVTIELTQREALMLMAFSRLIGGLHQGPRNIMDNLSDKLRHVLSTDYAGDRPEVSTMTKDTITLKGDTSK